MTDNRVVLVTGVADYWGARVAARLASESSVHVIGIDVKEPPEANEGLDFVQADVRNPALTDFLKAEGVQTVCHLQFSEHAERNEAVFDLNVIGTMKLFNACEQAGVNKVVFRSSTAVYGAHPDNSAFLSEETPLRGSFKYGYTRDWMEIEAFINGFRRESSQMAAIVLRFANIIGQEADTPMTRFLKQPSPTILLGFDPMIQMIHQDDVVEALAFAALNNVPDVCNIGAEDPMPLSRVLRLARKIPTHIFHPIAYRTIETLRSTRIQPLRFAPIEWDYLRYPWVADLGRMREELGFLPAYTAAEALREFVGEQRIAEGTVQPEDLAYDEQRLRDIIERRRRIRLRETATEEA